MPCAEAADRDWSYSQLQTLEHGFALDAALEAQVPVRKLGRVAALAQGLRHHGRNLVRQVAEMPAVTQLLGDREAAESDVDGLGRENEVALQHTCSQCRCMCVCIVFFVRSWASVCMHGCLRCSHCQGQQMVACRRSACPSVLRVLSM